MRPAGGSVEAATRQIELAMLRDRMLDYDTAGVEKQANVIARRSESSFEIP